MIKVFKKPTTINITITDNKKVDGKKITKTVSVIVPNKDKETINLLKKEVQKNVITPLTENTNNRITMQFRLDSNTRAGQLHLNSSMGVQEIHDHFMNM